MEEFKTIGGITMIGLWFCTHYIMHHSAYNKLPYYCSYVTCVLSLLKLDRFSGLAPALLLLCCCYCWLFCCSFVGSTDYTCMYILTGLPMSLPSTVWRPHTCTYCKHLPYLGCAFHDKLGIVSHTVKIPIRSLGQILSTPQIRENFWISWHSEIVDKRWKDWLEWQKSS